MSSVPQGKIECLECKAAGKKVHLKSLSGHIQVHHMSLQDYRDKYRDPDTGEEPPTGWTLGLMHKQNAPPPTQETATAAGPSRISLTAEETELYQSRVNVLFTQSDRDPALTEVIKTIALNEIFIQRYNTRISKLNAKLTSGASFTPNDAIQLKSLAGLLKDTTKSNLELMQSLSLTRDQKQKAKKSVETTPARLMAGYEQMVKNLPKEETERLNTEMEEAAARAEVNLQSLLLEIPADATTEDGGEPGV